MNNLDKAYTDLLQDILDNGITKSDRTGTGTLSVFGRQIRHKMSDGFPLLTTKKMAWKSIVTELLWFLRGDTNIKYLVDNDCHIWDGDAYKKYLSWYQKQSKHFNELGIVREPWTKEQYVEQIKLGNVDRDLSDLGPIYGKQWRKWQGWMDIPDVHRLAKGSLWYDQILRLIHQLKTEPDSRRLMVNAWNVGELDQMVLPPCHYGFQVYTRELSLEDRVSIFNSKMISEGIRTQIATVGVDETYWKSSLERTKHNIPTRAISLMYNARSQDVPLGTPFNIASYALLLEIIAKMVNMVPDELITNMGDCHIYLNQIDGIKEQLMRQPYSLPKLIISNQVNFNESIDEFLNSCLITDFKIEGYQSHPTIKMPLSN